MTASSSITGPCSSVLPGALPSSEYWNKHKKAFIERIQQVIARLNLREKDSIPTFSTREMPSFLSPKTLGVFG